MKRFMAYVFAPLRRALMSGTGNTGAAARGFFLSGLFIIACAGVSYAQSGGIPGQFMSYGAGARGLGMGGAFFAVADDSSASYWNPAALTMLERKEFSAMQATMFADTTLNFFTYAHPTTTKGTWAISMTQLKSVGLRRSSPRTQHRGHKHQTLGTFDSVEPPLAFSSAATFRKSFPRHHGQNISRTLDTCGPTPST
jgi:hypothetical protein